MPENPEITALAKRWVQRIQSRPAADLKALVLRDGPVVVMASGVLAGQGDPISVTYAGGDPPNGRVALYSYVYDVRFQQSNVREILLIDDGGNLREVLFASDHPVSP